jgi:hypothetical protein
MLLDHFHPPLSRLRPWHALHHAWATAIAADLNMRMPPGWFAAPHVQFGYEIDVAAVEEPELASVGIKTHRGEGSPELWQAPAPTLTVDFPPVTDRVEVEVFAEHEELRLAGAIELVSPANKDRREHRDAFLAKCEALLRDGLGLIVVDVVTSRRFAFHTALMKRLRQPAGAEPKEQTFAAAYRPVDKQGQRSLEVWVNGLALQQPLPTLPLHLLHGPCVPVDLNSTYDRACRELRVPV